jgi:uncharacterized protein YqeY
MDKRTQFKTSLTEAMKAKDEIRVSTLRLVMAALKDKDIEARGQGNPDGISEPQILSLLQNMLKQRKESSATYRSANRADLADREDAEIKIIQEFMPQQMSDAEAQQAIEKLIAETGAAGVKDMGKVMGELKNRYAGQMDMGKASGLIKQKLAG